MTKADDPLTDSYKVLKMIEAELEAAGKAYDLAEERYEEALVAYQYQFAIYLKGRQERKVTQMEVKK